MIDILLATYNGEKYIAELLESLIAQTEQRFRLIVCDDGSEDNTLSIVQQYSDRIDLEIHRNRANLGVVQTFSRLLGFSKAPYVMFCDQDDVWLPKKIEQTLAKMTAAEKAHPGPVLVHTDLTVVDEQLQPIAPSYWQLSCIYPKRTKTINRLLVQNVVTGCTAMLNRELIEVCGHIPTGAIMHDWWIALAASAFGHIAVCDQKTILYRQHAKNTLGAKAFLSIKALKESFNRQRSMAKKKRRQAEKFASVYHHLLSDDQLSLIDTYTLLSDYGLFKRVATICKFSFFRQGLLRNLGSFAGI